MRVLLLTANPDLPETHLIKGLIAKGVEIDFMANPNTKHAHILKDAAINIEYLPDINRFDLKTVKIIRNKIKSKKYDIIHSLTSRALSNSLIATFDKKYRQIKHIAYRGTIGHLSYFDPASRLSHLSPRVDRIVCVSNAVKDYLIQMRIPEHKLVTIYKGHKLEWYNDASKIDLANLNLPENKFLVGCVANMRAVKGVDVLLEGIKLLDAKLDLHFLIVGEVRDKKIINLAKDPRIKDRIHFTGFRNDASKLVGSCHAFIMPSRAREGLPKAVIEAMAQAVAPIVTNVGGMPELVEDQKCGLVVPPSNPLELAQAIMQLYNDREMTKNFGLQAQTRIEQKFNIESTIEKTFEMYCDLLRSEIRC